MNDRDRVAGIVSRALDVFERGKTGQTLAEIAAAIALLEEREGCATILDAAASRQKAVWDALQAKKHPGPYTSHEELYRHFAAAIRARGGAG